MILDKINNNTYLFLLIIILIIILFNMSCFMENKVNYTTFKQIKLNKTTNENFDEILYITSINLIESETHKHFFNKDLDINKKIYSLVIRLKNNNKLFDINLLNLKKGDLIKFNSKSKNSEMYLKINKINNTLNKPGYSDIEIIDEKEKLTLKKNKLDNFFNTLKGNNYNKFKIQKIDNQSKFVLSYNINIIKNTNYINISDSNYYIKFTSPNDNINIENINKFTAGDIITLKVNNNNNKFTENKNMYKINVVDKNNYILFLDNINNNLSSIINSQTNNYNNNNDKEILIKIDYIDKILNDYFYINTDNIAKLQFNQQQINNYKNHITQLKNEIKI